MSGVLGVSGACPGLVPLVSLVPAVLGACVLGTSVSLVPLLSLVPQCYILMCPGILGVSLVPLVSAWCMPLVPQESLVLIIHVPGVLFAPYAFLPS